jgi:hypothetical protein
MDFLTGFGLLKIFEIRVLQEAAAVGFTSSLKSLLPLLFFE